MKIIECPRDAMQGLHEFIPTEQKVRYINALMEVGFDTIDFGSFVSAKAIPQMKDTAQVLGKLEWEKSKSQLLAIVGNSRGASDASAFPGISYIGFPFSISETFQKRNTNKSIIEGLNTLEEIQNICQKHNKKLVSYISMGFGNPYGDPYSADLVAKFVDILVTLGSRIISLADTIGASTPATITSLFQLLSAKHPSVEIGVHLHSTPQTSIEKIQAAFNAGCKRFDGAIRGFGGCPMAKDELVGNIATETLVNYLQGEHVSLQIDHQKFATAQRIADEIFPKR